MIQLRPYQDTLVAAIRSSLASHSRVLAVSPTGSGKTVTFSYIASRARERGKRIGIFAHRAELLDQISKTLKQFNVPHGMITSGASFVPGQSVYVCSAQTYAKRVGTARAPVFDLGIIDEAHHCTDGSTWGKCMVASPDARWIGVTATPERLDGRGLAESFDDMVLGPTPRELIAAGALSDYRLFCPSTIDLTGVHTVAGDYNRGELAEAVDRPSVTGDAVRHYTTYLNGAPSAAFCVSILHAQHVAEEFRAAGYKAASVDGKMDPSERARIVGEFSRGELNVLTSCDLISEGFDVPGMHGAILLRPTQSLSLFMQQVGRALRTAPGKERAIIMDHAGNVGRHGLPDADREWSLEGRRKGEKRAPVESVRQCERCACAFESRRSECPECGWRPAVNIREIEKVDGELTEVDKDAARERAAVIASQAKARDLDSLMALGHSEQRARHILAAREEKEVLRNRLRAMNPPLTYREILELKPKGLRHWIEKLEVANEDVGTQGAVARTG